MEPHQSLEKSIEENRTHTKVLLSIFDKTFSEPSNLLGTKIGIKHRLH